MAQDSSVVVDDRPGELVGVGEATPRVGVKARRWSMISKRRPRCGSRMFA